MPIRYYVLLGRLPVPCEYDEWVRFSAEHDRTIKETEVGGGLLWVSTVFLGLDHNIFGDGPPLLFETMIFDGGEDRYQARCSTWDEAEKQHAEAITFAEELVTRCDLKSATEALSPGDASAFD